MVVTRYRSYERFQGVTVGTYEELPTKIPIGAVFMWRGRMLRKGRGILYAAHPCCRGIIYDSYVKRAVRRRATR